MSVKASRTVHKIQGNGKKPCTAEQQAHWGAMIAESKVDYHNEYEAFAGMFGDS